MVNTLKVVEWFILAFVLGLLACIMSSCSSTTDRQTNIVEVEQVRTGPLIIDTPFGQFTAQPTTVIRQRTQDEVEKSRKTIEIPDVLPVLAAAAGSTPWGGILSGIGGLALAAFAGKKALDNGRQRDEVISGVERGKALLPPDHQATMLAALEAEQSADTKRIVAKKTT